VDGGGGVMGVVCGSVWSVGLVGVGVSGGRLCVGWGFFYCARTFQGLHSVAEVVNIIFNYIPEGDVVIRLTYFPNTPPLPSPSLNFEVFF
jgi:hypothetical protein